MTLDLTAFCWYLDRPWPWRLRVVLHCAPRHSNALRLRLNEIIGRPVVRAQGSTLHVDEPEGVVFLAEALEASPDQLAAVRAWAMEMGKGRKGVKIGEELWTERRRAAEMAMHLMPRSS